MRRMQCAPSAEQKELIVHGVHRSIDELRYTLQETRQRDAELGKYFGLGWPSIGCPPHHEGQHLPLVALQAANSLRPKIERG
jgi:hypothetical protein